MRNPLVLALACVATVPAYADISYSQKISIEAGGSMSMLASTGETVTQISGDRSRSDTRVEMDSRLMRMAAGSGTTGAIVRLDKQLTWNLLPDEQQYTEVSFAEAREQLRQSLEMMEQNSASGLPVNDESCQWSDASIDVEKTGEKEKIVGLKTRKHVIRMQQTCTDPKSGKSCDMTWVMETWLASKVPAQKEVEKFHAAYVKAMGLGDTAKHMQGPAQAMMGMFGDNWEQVVDEVEDIKGYPLRTVMQMGMGGEQCTTAQGQPIAMDDIWADASTSAYNAALGQAGAEAGAAVGRATGEALGDSIAGSIGGAAVGAAAGEIIGGLGGMFKKKKKSEQPVPESVPEENRQVTLFRISTEVTAWSENSIPAERFEEPEGWSKR